MNKVSNNIHIFKRLTTVLFALLLVLYSTGIININADNEETYNLTVEAKTTNDEIGTFNYYIRFYKEETPTTGNTITLNVNFIDFNGNPKTLPSNPKSYDYVDNRVLKYNLYKGENVDDGQYIETTSSFPNEGWTYDSTSNSFSYIFNNIEEGQNYIIASETYGQVVGQFKTEDYDDEEVIKEITINEMFDFDSSVWIPSQNARAGETVNFTHDIEITSVISFPQNNLLSNLTDLFKVKKIYAEGSETPYTPTNLPEGLAPVDGTTGAYTFSLSTNETKTFNLPSGVSYEVYELKEDGTRASVNDDVGNDFKLIEETNTTGTIDQSNITASFLNEKNAIDINDNKDNTYVTPKTGIE